VRRSDEFIRLAGTAAEAVCPAGYDERRQFSWHLAAHAVAEEQVTGTCTKTLNMEAPCPYCGKLPPGAVVPRSITRKLA